MRSCLICDDHAMMRDALAGTVAMAWPEATISLSADFPAAWAAAKAHPELILCDLGMPGATPIAGVAGLRAAAPAAPLVVVTASEDDRVLLEAFDAGIAGYLPKTSTGPVIEAAIRLVLSGGRYLPVRMLALAVGGRSAIPNPAAAHARLTDRQMDVLRELARGRSNKDIARALCLSPATVKAHVAAVIAALGAGNRTEASFKARIGGLL